MSKSTFNEHKVSYAVVVKGIILAYRELLVVFRVGRHDIALIQIKNCVLIDVVLT